MALVAISNSLRSLNCADKSHCALSFDPLHSISNSTGACGSVRSEISVADYCSSAGRVSKSALSPRVWPSSRSSERRKAKPSVSPNASSTPESQTTDNETAEGTLVQFPPLLRFTSAGFGDFWKAFFHGNLNSDPTFCWSVHIILN